MAKSQTNYKQNTQSYKLSIQFYYFTGMRKSQYNPEQSNDMRNSIQKTKLVNSQTQSPLKYQAKPQLSIDTRFDTQLLRIKVQQHARQIQALFSLSESQLSHAMLSYDILPHSPIKISSLTSLKTCKLIKSTQNKIYLGQTLNKKKHGLGVAIYADGKVYQGSFLNNERAGFGVQAYSNGNIYVGDFHQNKKHGKGVFFWFSLSEIPCTKTSEVIIEHYKGSWWGGLPDGKGEHYRSNGDIYVGQFKNGLKHGKGIENYFNGDIYEGDFVNGLPEGNGVYLWADGSQYNGDFKQGYRNGYGIWKNKHKDETFQGHYMLDRKHGYGVYDWGNGYTYKGNYVQDMRSGQGKLLYEDQVVYEGQWVNGEKMEEIQVPHKSKLFSASKTHNSALTKSTNMENLASKVGKSRLFSSKQKSNPIEKSKSRLRSNQSSKIANNRSETYYVSFKQQEVKKQEKVRIGHRNCVPCQILHKRQTAATSLSRRSNKKSTSKSKK